MSKSFSAGAVLTAFILVQVPPAMAAGPHTCADMRHAFDRGDNAGGARLVMEATMAAYSVGYANINTATPDQIRSIQFGIMAMCKDVTNSNLELGSVGENTAIAVVENEMNAARYGRHKR